jgi:hypothetical protein
MKEKNTLANEFLNYASDVDTGKVDIFNIRKLGNSPEDISTYNKLRKSQDDALVFLLHHLRGSLNIEDFGEIFTLKNANIVINTFMDVSTNKDSALYLKLNTITSMIRNKSLIINFNCD